MDSDMQARDEACEKICGILRKQFDIAEEKLDRAFWKEPLTGYHFKLAGADMVYLLFEMERAFAIRMNEEFLGNYGFSTIEKAAEAVMKSMGVRNASTVGSSGDK